jgi:hypothetical protein
METYGGSECIAFLFLTSTLWAEWSILYPCPFNLGETITRTHGIGGWVAPKAGLDAMVNRKIPYLYQESKPDSSVMQQVAWLLY